MSDYINRQDAIDAIPETRVDIFENCRNCELLDKFELLKRYVGDADDET